jgi:hypothetical protein
MNVHFLREDAEHEQPSSKHKIPTEFKKAIEAEGEFTKVPLSQSQIELYVLELR